jgi:large subunit ribosomal protein L9
MVATSDLKFRTFCSIILAGGQQPRGAKLIAALVALGRRRRDVEILLLKDIKRLGKAGEVRKVADGYARNYLIPRGLAEHLSGVTLTFRVKAGEKGRLYGSVTAADIAAEIEKRTGYPIDKRKVALEEPLHLLGQHKVPLKLVAGLMPEVTVVVEEAAD